jgi:hypothetical protein
MSGLSAGTVMSMVPDITGGTGTESDETPGWWWPVGLSQSEGTREMAVSVDGALFRVPGHLGVGRPSIYTTASGRIYPAVPSKCQQRALYDRMAGKPVSGNALRPSRQDSEFIQPRKLRHARCGNVVAGSIPRQRCPGIIDQFSDGSSM